MCECLKIALAVSCALLTFVTQTILSARRGPNVCGVLYV
jgi:hypothetical protein